VFAAALAPDVRVRILDEPTEGLDPTKRGAVLDLLTADARRGTTVLLSSHHLGEVSRACDRIVFLAQGRKIADETSASVASRARRYVRLQYALDDPRLGADHGAGHGEHLGAERVRASLQSIASVASVRTEITASGAVRVGIVLDVDDPRAFLAAAMRDASMPVPDSIEYGQLSLSELYRELYGVEGC